LSKNGATFCVLPDPFQGVRSGTSFDRPPRRFVHSFGTRVGWTPTRTADGRALFLVPRPARRRPATALPKMRCKDASVACCPGGPSGFDIRTFDCARCNRVHIVTVATDLVIDSHSLHARSIDALAEAREMPPGAPRTEALKKAGLLRRTVDDQGVVFAKRGRPRKR
jgi:hypothetical protein